MPAADKRQPLGPHQGQMNPILFSHNNHANNNNMNINSSRRRVVGGSEISMGMREEIVVDRDTEKEVYEGELFRLRKDNESLKDVLNRALKELKAYQVRFPSAYAGIVSDAESEEFSHPMFAGSDAVIPLLHTYDCRIKELEDIAVMQVNKLETVHSQLEDLVKENNELRQLNLDQVGGKSGAGAGGFSSNQSLQQDLINELNERVDILMSENALLVEQKACLGEELDAYHSELSARTEQLNEVSAELLALQQEAGGVNETLTRTQEERDSAAVKLLEHGDAVGKLEASMDSMRAELSVWQARASQAETAIKDVRAKYKEAEGQYSADCEVFMRRTKTAEDRVTELHTQLLLKTTEYDDVSELYRKCKREYASTRTDAEGMLQVMSSLERQVHDYATKEARAEGVVRESKSKVEEALRARDQALTRDVQHQKEIERLMDERKKEAGRRDLEVEEAVERANTRAAIQHRALEAELAGVLEKNSQLRVHGEKASREFRSIKEALSRSAAAYTEEKKGIEAAMKMLEEKVAHTVNAREEEGRQRQHVQEQNTELRTLIDSLRGQIETMRVQTETLRTQHEAELAEFRTVNRELNKEVGDKTRQLSRRTKDFEELKAVVENKGQENTRELEETVQGLRRRVSEYEKQQYESESSRIQEGIAHAAFVSDLKSRAAQTTSQLDTKCKELKIENDRQAFKLRETESLARQLTEDKHTQYAAIASLKSKLVKCQEDLIEAHSQLSEANIQFANQLENRASHVGSNSGGSSSSSSAAAAVAVAGLLGTDDHAVGTSDESFNYDDY